MSVLWHQPGSWAARSGCGTAIRRSCRLFQSLTLACGLGAMLPFGAMLTFGMAQAEAAGWQVKPDPVWQGQYAAVGDPSVVRVGATYLMFHHCLDVQRMPQGGEVCLAKSVDGLNWRYARTNLSSRLVRGRLLQAQIGPSTDFARQTSPPCGILWTSRQ